MNGSFLKAAMAGAAAGILIMLTLTITVLSKADEHYVTRREYEATLKGIETSLAELKALTRADRPQPSGMTPRAKGH